MRFAHVTQIFNRSMGPFSGDEKVDHIRLLYPQRVLMLGEPKKLSQTFFAWILVPCIDVSIDIFRHCLSGENSIDKG